MNILLKYFKNLMGSNENINIRNKKREPTLISRLEEILNVDYEQIKNLKILTYRQIEKFLIIFRNSLAVSNKIYYKKKNYLVF